MAIEFLMFLVGVCFRSGGAEQLRALDPMVMSRWEEDESDGRRRRSWSTGGCVDVERVGEVLNAEVVDGFESEKQGDSGAALRRD